MAAQRGKVRPQGKRLLALAHKGQRPFARDLDDRHGEGDRGDEERDDERQRAAPDIAPAPPRGIEENRIGHAQEPAIGDVLSASASHLRQSARAAEPRLNGSVRRSTSGFRRSTGEGEITVAAGWRARRSFATRQVCQRTTTTMTHACACTADALDS
jgi:hypothetical protein